MELSSCANILYVILLDCLELVLAEYSRSSPCDHSRGLVTTTFVKPRLDSDLNNLVKKLLKATTPVSGRERFWDYPNRRGGRLRELRLYLERSYPSSMLDVCHVNLV